MCAEGFACWRFVNWLSNGVDNPRRYRMPTRRRYQSIFPEEFRPRVATAPAETSNIGSSSDYGALVLLGDLIRQSFDGAEDWAEMGIPR